MGELKLPLLLLDMCKLCLYALWIFLFVKHLSVEFLTILLEGSKLAEPLLILPEILKFDLAWVLDRLERHLAFKFLLIWLLIDEDSVLIKAIDLRISIFNNRMIHWRSILLLCNLKERLFHILGLLSIIFWADSFDDFVYAYRKTLLFTNLLDGAFILLILLIFLRIVLFGL